MIAGWAESSPADLLVAQVELPAPQSALNNVFEAIERIRSMVAGGKDGKEADSAIWDLTKSLGNMSAQGKAGIVWIDDKHA